MQSRCFSCLRHKFHIHPFQGESTFFSTTSPAGSNKENCKSLLDRCALITEGTSGIGLECAKSLLAQGCKGVTLAGNNGEEGENALRCICETYGNNKAVFLKCDCSKPESIDFQFSGGSWMFGGGATEENLTETPTKYLRAFKNTIRVFDRLDIVINNACVLNDKQWEQEISTNINGCLITSLLGLQYMSRTCQGSGGIVVNIASTMGITPLHGCPIYSMTQSAIVGLTRSLGGGSHVQRTGVKIMCMCVGLSDECLLQQGIANAINDKFSKEFRTELKGMCIQKQCVREALNSVLEDQCSGSVWVVDQGGPACKLKFPCVEELLTCCSVPSKTSNKS